MCIELNVCPKWVASFFHGQRWKQTEAGWCVLVLHLWKREVEYTSEQNSCDYVLIEGTGHRASTESTAVTQLRTYYI